MILGRGMFMRRTGRISLIGLLVVALLIFLVPGYAEASVRNASVALSTDRAGAVAQYTIGFYVSGSGALTGGRDEVTILFPDGTEIPEDLADELAANTIVVNGYSVEARDLYVKDNQLIITLPAEADVRGYGYVGIIIGEGAGIQLPRKAGTYTMEIETTRDSDGTTNSFTVDGTSITSLDLTVSPAAIDEYAAYEFSFKTSSQGALKPSVDYLYIEFPEEVVLPRSIDGEDIQINGKEVASDGVTIDADTNTLEILIPRRTDIGTRDTVEVVIDSGAGIRNPRKAGTYTVNVYTSADSESADEDFTVGLSINTPVVFISPSEAEQRSQYTIGFTTSATGALEAGKDTITVYFPEDTSIPSSINTSYVKVNGTKAKAVECSRSNETITVTVPTGITIGDNTYVSIVFALDAGIRNPEDAGNYQLEVCTSADDSKVKSRSYTVTGTDPDEDTDEEDEDDEDSNADNDDDFTVELSNYGLGQAVSILFSYENGTFGELKRGDKLYLIFAADFTLPNTVTAQHVAVNGLKADAVERSGQAIVVTIPGGVDLVDDERTVITILQDAGVKNPGKEGVHSLFAYSSVKPSIIEDFKVTIGTGSSNNNNNTGTNTGNTGNEGKVVFKIGSNIAYQGTKAITLDAPPTIVQNFTVVPLRALGDALGAETVYEGTTRTVTVTYGNKTLVFYIDSKLVKVDKEWITADIPATLINNRVMIPVRLVSESFGAIVDWNDATREVIITK